MKKHIGALLIVCLSTSLYCQQYFGHTHASPAALLQNHSLPIQSNSKLYDQEIERQIAEPYTAMHFATAIPYTVDIVAAADWEQVDDDKLVGRYALTSAQALSLNFYFSDIYLPKGTTLNLYNPNDGNALIPYDQGLDTDQLWTAILYGDQVVIELVTTATSIGDIRLVLDRVHHDFTGFGSLWMRASGSCNLDVVCGAADGFEEVEALRAQISSVGAYHFNGTEICTGVAINNTARDCTPYFLTAFHCGVTSSTAPSMVVYWNYQNSYCRQPYTPQSGQPGDGQLTQYTSGGSVRAAWAGTDFTLVELNNPIAEEYQVVLSGWDRTDEIPTSTAVIHHPGVEEKRISFDHDAPIVDNSSVGNGRMLRIQDWDVGTTEGGSSGAPLYNQKGQIVGQLFGGNAACSNNEWDNFGWFFKSWTGGGSAANSLRPWLDQNGTNETNLSAHNCSYALTFDADDAFFCKSGSSPNTLTVKPNEAFNTPGLLMIVDADGLDLELTSTQVQYESNTQLRILNLEATQAGNYTVKLAALVNTSEVLLDVPIAIDGVQPDSPETIAPLNGAEELELEQTLTWNANLGARSYEVLIAEDEIFEKIVGAYVGLTQSQIVIETLLPNKTYYWKVNAENACGKSNWSTASSFSTGVSFCTTLYNTTEVEIPLTAIEINYQIECPYDVRVSDVSVPQIRGRHSYVSDLYFKVKKGTTRVDLWGGGCGSAIDFSLGFTDDNLLAASCPITDGKLHKPAQTLNSYDGQSAIGRWDIIVEDKESQDGGQLQSAALKVCFDKTYQDMVVASTNTLFGCGEVYEFEIFADIENAEFISFSLQDQQNNNIPLQIQAVAPYLNKNVYTVGVYSDDILSGNTNLTLKAAFGLSEVTTNLKLVDAESPESNPILFPLSGQRVNPNEVVNLAFANAPTQLTQVEVASDPNFEDILFVMEYVGSASGSLQYPWVDGSDYYLRSVNFDPFVQCGAYSETMVLECRFVSATEDLREESKLLVFPNPSSNQVTISSVSKEKVLSLQLFSLDGSNVVSAYFGSPIADYVLPVSHLPKGLYFLKVTLENQTYLVEKLSVD